MNLFEQNNEDPVLEDKDYYTELVGEGKKFKTERDLARGKAESDLFIEQLKRENAEMRNELNSRQTAEQIAEKILNRSNTSVTSPSINKEDSNQSNPNSGISEDDEDVDTKVDKRLRAILREQQEEQNLVYVRNALEESFGKNFGKQLAEITQEINETEETMTRLAKTNPKAFLKLVGATSAQATKQKQDTLFSPPTSSVGIKPTKTEKGWSYYKNLRLTNPTLYRSIPVQQEMFRKAKEFAERGENFYAT